MPMYAKVPKLQVAELDKISKAARTLAEQLVSGKLCFE